MLEEWSRSGGPRAKRWKDGTCHTRGSGQRSFWNAVPGAQPTPRPLGLHLRGGVMDLGAREVAQQSQWCGPVPGPAPVTPGS